MSEEPLHVLEYIDTDQIEREHKIPLWVIEQFKVIGAFGIKILQQYGGLSLSPRSYGKAMGMVTSVDASLTTLLVAHQSIGAPQPLLHFGTEEQKQKYLPRLARALFHAIVIFGTRLEKRQSVLARLIDIGAELYAMTASCVHAQAMLRAQPDNDVPVEMAVLFCCQSRRRVKRLFKTIFNNDDTQNYKLARDVLEGKHIWLEQDLPNLVEEKDAGRSIANGVTN